MTRDRKDCIIHSNMTIKIQKYLFFLFAFVALAVNGDVVINEIAAATSDRILNFSAGYYPTLGAEIPWQEIEYNDTAWKTGAGPLGFGVSWTNTDLQSELYGKATTLYIRQKFIVSATDAAKTNALRLQVDYDDGFIAFVNGKEIARKNMGPAGAFGFHDQDAYNPHGAGTPENIYFPNASDILVEGTNVIAIQLHNKGTENPMVISADLFINSSPEIQLVNNSDEWKYFIGLAEPSGGIFDPRVLQPEPLHILWGDSDFNDSAWSSGPGGLGYDDGDDATVVNIRNVAISLYIRQPFFLNSLTTNSLTLTVDYDDAFIAYLNGYEIARRNMGSVGEFFAHDKPSTGDHEAGTPVIISLPDAYKFLVIGTNVLAVQTHNWSIDSSDMTIKADLSAAGFSEQFIYHTNIWRYMIGTNEPAAIPNPPKEYDDDFVDWIELYNSSPTSVNLKGWSITDDETKPDKWIFPEKIIPAGEYLVILCDEQNITSTASAYLHTNFKLTKDGEFLGLFDNSSPRNLISGFSPSYPQQSFFHTYGWCAASNSYLYFSQATPGTKNSGETFAGITATPVFDKPPGFYGGVSISITTATQNAEIRYTTNGSEPTESSTLYSSSLNPSQTIVYRARAFKPGMIPSKTVTRTYILYANNVLRSVPIVSIVTDWNKNFFKPNGITAIVGGHWDNSNPWIGNWFPDSPDDYNIPMQRGRPYERPISIEFLYYGTGIWNQTDCGIRIAGSDYTRPKYRLQNLSGQWKNTCPHVDKPQFNIYFRSDYGEKNLNFDLIPNYTIKKFNSLRLRGGKNDWQNPFIVDEFVRRIFIKTGQQGSKGFLAWLFVNGEQKAYFNPCERYDEKFFQEHYDSNEDWDILNHSYSWNNEVTEGDDVAWNNMLNYLESHNLENLNEYIAATQMIDVVNFTDYLIVETYGANWDWPNNNWYAARERSDKGLFRFYAWDMEGCFFVGNLNSITQDAFNTNPAWQSGGGSGLNGEDTPIARIYRRLILSPEFRLLFADRIQKHFFNNGCMTESNLISEWNKLKNIIEPMFSSFFPGSFDNRTRTEWIPQRRQYYFPQLANENLWPDTHAPYFNQHGGTITSGFQVVIYNTNSAGTIYYTTDGSDPRQFGGAIHGSQYSSPFSLEHSTKVKARVLRSGEWSPLCEATFVVTGVQKIVVSEIMYNPLGGSDYEFIELKNISGGNLDISDLAFTDGIYFDFAKGAVTHLNNDAFVVVVKSNAVFASRYNTNDILIAGEYEGKLKNSGERIELENSFGESIIAFIYSDEWYSETDGGGYSLVIENPNESTNLWNEAAGWRASYFTNGSPGKVDIPESCSIFLFLLLYSISLTFRL